MKIDTENITSYWLSKKFCNPRRLSRYSVTKPGKVPLQTLVTGFEPHLIAIPVPIPKIYIDWVGCQIVQTNFLHLGLAGAGVWTQRRPDTAVITNVLCTMNMPVYTFCEQVCTLPSEAIVAFRKKHVIWLPGFCWKLTYLHFPMSSLVFEERCCFQASIFKDLTFYLKKSYLKHWSSTYS